MKNAGSVNALLTTPRIYRGTGYPAKHHVERGPSTAARDEGRFRHSATGRRQPCDRRVAAELRRGGSAMVVWREGADAWLVGRPGRAGACLLAARRERRPDRGAGDRDDPTGGGAGPPDPGLC